MATNQSTFFPEPAKEVTVSGCDAGKVRKTYVFHGATKATH